MNHFREKADFIRRLAEMLRGPYRPHQYGDVILPLTVLRRLDRVLEPTREKVLAPPAGGPRMKCLLDSNVRVALLRACSLPGETQTPFRI